MTCGVWFRYFRTSGNIFRHCSGFTTMQQLDPSQDKVSIIEQIVSSLGLKTWCRLSPLWPGWLGRPFMVLLKQWRSHPCCPSPVLRNASPSPPPKPQSILSCAIIYLWNLKFSFCSSKGGECGVIGALLLRPITLHYFISMRERWDIKFPHSGLSIYQSKPNTGLTFTGGFVSSTRGLWLGGEWRSEQIHRAAAQPEVPQRSPPHELPYESQVHGWGRIKVISIRYTSAHLRTDVTPPAPPLPGHVSKAAPVCCDGIVLEEGLPWSRIQTWCLYPLLFLTTVTNVWQRNLWKEGFVLDLDSRDSVHHGQERIAAGTGGSVSLHPQPGSRKKWILVLNSLSSVYSV